MRERYSFWILYTSYLLSITKIKREIERRRKREIHNKLNLKRFSPLRDVKQAN